MARPRRRHNMQSAVELNVRPGAQILKHFILDRQSGLPLYLQIAHELMYLIESGTLRDGDAPPSLRQLAKQLRISFLTVDKAYKWLQARGVLDTRRGIGWRVLSVREQPNHDAREKLCLNKFVDETLALALEQGFDPMTFARNVVRRATAIEQRVPTRKLAFVECHSSFVDDYVSELAKELSEFNVEIRGLLTASFKEPLNKKSPDREFLESADYVLTTFYHVSAVKQFVSSLNKRVIALSLSLHKGALYEIVSLDRCLRVGAILSPKDPAPTIVKSLEYYRDLPSGSIPYAIVTDSAAVRRLRAKTDSIAFTVACREQMSGIFKKDETGILLRFGPSEDDIRKVQALLGSSLGRPSSHQAT